MGRLRCNLKEILNNKGISMSQLSQDIDHRRPTISNLANNVNIDTARIPASLIAKICVYLAISPNDLFTVIDDE